MTRDLSVLRRIRPSSTQLLARILELPDLATSVQALPAPVLAKVIDAVGLVDAAEIIAFATPEQLAGVFDEDLWRSEHAGADERFDSDRFLVWLEVMMEAGESFVAERLATLPEDLVALALHQHLLVLDVDELFVEMRGVDEQEGNATEKALSNCLSEEIDRYQLVARRHDGWDALWATVLALDRDHHDVLARILERLCAMTAEQIDREGGLHGVLTSEEMLEADVAGDREDRRAELGYVAPADARAFLKLARQPMTELPREHDPVTRAYFRGLAKSPKGSPRARGPRQTLDPDIRNEGGARAEARTERSGLGRLLLEAGVVTSRAEATRQLGSGAADRTLGEPLLVRAMRALAEVDATAFATRSEEIAYLANVLVAGASIEGRRYRPAEAVQKAIDVCSQGLELASKNVDPVETLRKHPALGLFRLVWSSGG